jgi:hypothetical protein
MGLPTPRIILPLALMALQGAIGIAHAQQPPPSDDRSSLESIVTDLGSSDPILREDAAARLSQLGASSPREIFDVMKRPGMTLDQRKRLESAARVPFESSPRAGLGVSFDRADEENVRLVGTVQNPNFHAHEVLKPGDILREMDGLVVHTRAQAQAAILSHDPEETIDLLVQRQGALFRYKIRLGSYAQLERGPGGGIGMGIEGTNPLPAAFRIRLARELGEAAIPDDTPPLDAGLDVIAWKDAEARVRAKVARETERAMPASQRAAMPRLAAAGVSHESPRATPGQHLTKAQREKYESLIAYTKANISAIETQQLQRKLLITRPGIQQRDIELIKMQSNEAESRLQDLKIKLEEYQQLLTRR